MAAVPVTFNIVPNGRDAIMGMEYAPADTVFGTTVYRRYTRNWRKPIANVSAPGSGNSDLMPGPLIKARVGDKLRVHFKNLDTAFNRPHSMHFHGVEYKPSSDGSYLPGLLRPRRRRQARPDLDLQAHRGQGLRRRLAVPRPRPRDGRARSKAACSACSRSSAGASSAPDREYVVIFSPMGKFQAIDGRAFVGNTPVFKSRVGELVQWDVMAMGSEHHTFHVHGHRWRGADGVPVDTVTVGPAESLRVRWRERDPGTWLYHCHVETHMEAGMIGTYQLRLAKGSDPLGSP